MRLWFLCLKLLWMNRHPPVPETAQATVVADTPETVIETQCPEGDHSHDGG